MSRKTMPDEVWPSGEVYGPDGEPVRFGRAHAINGYMEPVPPRHGRERAMLDEESVYLCNRGVHFEE